MVGSVVSGTQPNVRQPQTLGGTAPPLADQYYYYYYSSNGETPPVGQFALAPPVAVGMPLSVRQEGGEGVNPGPVPPPTTTLPLGSNPDVLRLGPIANRPFYFLNNPNTNSHLTGEGPSGTSALNPGLPPVQYPIIPHPDSVNGTSTKAEEDVEHLNVNAQFLPEPDEEERRARYGSGAFYLPPSEQEKEAREKKKQKKKDKH